MAELSTIKIPEKVYVGFQGRRSEDEVPLGFMTPYDETSAGKKRQATVDGWAKGYGHQKTFNSVIIENVPMIGFKIGRAIRRSSSFGGNSVVVRIEDPRGFELEIGVENLVVMLDGNIMEDCELLMECVWGRDGGKNVLLPVNSAPYAEYLDTQKRIENKVSLKDLKPGDQIEVLGGRQGIFLGALYSVGVKRENSGWRNDYADDTTTEPVIADKKRHVVRYGDQEGGSYETFTSLKVGHLIKSASRAMTPSEIEELISKDVEKGKGRATISDSTKNLETLAFVTSIKDTKIEVSRQEVDEKYFAGLRYAYYEIIIASNTGREIWISQGENFPKSDRARQGRYYEPERRSGYSYYGNRVEVKTDGFIGHEFKQDGLKFAHNERTTTHVPDDGNTKFEIVNAKFTSNHGVTITTRI